MRIGFSCSWITHNLSSFIIHSRKVVNATRILSFRLFFSEMSGPKTRPSLWFPSIWQTVKMSILLRLPAITESKSGWDGISIGHFLFIRTKARLFDLLSSPIESGLALPQNALVIPIQMNLPQNLTSSFRIGKHRGEGKEKSVWCTKFLCVWLIETSSKRWEESEMEMKLSEWQKIRLGEGNKFPKGGEDYRQVNWRGKRTGWRQNKWVK